MKPRVWYRKPWFSILVISLFFVAVGAVIVVPVGATDTLSYCASCKVTKRAETTWERSPHKDVSCTECHIPSGFVSQVKWRVNEARNIWASYLNVPRVSNKGEMPGNAACLKCHPISKIPDEQSGVRMSHKLHVNLRGLTCVDCHDSISHTKPGQSTGVTMQTCPMCHNEQGAPNRCDFCHPAPPANAHRPNFLKEHGKEARLNLQACLRCHHDKKQFCDACHATPPANHFSGTWRYTHKAAAVKDPTSCDACHSTAYCAQCHAVQHPSDWVSTHGPTAAKGQSACLVCHPQTMCDTCHAKQGVKL